MDMFSECVACLIGCSPNRYKPDDTVKISPSCGWKLGNANGGPNEVNYADAMEMAELDSAEKVHVVLFGNRA